jgi:Tfp pilus assembly protein PilF
MKRTVFIVFLVLTACATTSGPPVDKTKMAEGYYMKGYSFFQDGKYELAWAEFNRSIQTDSSYKQSYYMLGVICEYREQYDLAVVNFKEAVDRDPNYSEAYNAMGTSYSKQKKWKEALKAYNKALENPLYTTPHITYVNIARLYMEQKNYEKAVEAYRDAKRYSKQDFILYELGMALFDAGRVKDAIKEYREAVAIAPQNALVRYQLGIALVRDGNKKAALDEFKKTMELAPGSEVAMQAKDYIRTLR